MRRRVRGRPLLVVTMAATIAACSGEPEMDTPDAAWVGGNDGGWRPDAFIGDTIRDGGFPPGSRTDAGPVDEDSGAEPADGGE